MFCEGNFEEKKFGAGEGNRTLTASLEGWNSTVELHPPTLKLRREGPLRFRRIRYFCEPPAKDGLPAEARRAKAGGEGRI